MENKHKPKGPYEKYFKRPIDFCCGMAAVIVFCWLYIIIAVLVRIKLGSPVLFTQARPGKDEKILHATGKPIVESRQNRIQNTLVFC